MEFHFREGDGCRGQGITVIADVLVIGVFLIAIIINSDDDDSFLVIIIPTSTSQQKEKVE
jgi:hypothetical protein